VRGAQIACHGWKAPSVLLFSIPLARDVLLARWAPPVQFTTAGSTLQSHEAGPTSLFRWQRALLGPRCQSLRFNARHAITRGPHITADSQSVLPPTGREVFTLRRPQDDHRAKGGRFFTAPSSARKPEATLKRGVAAHPETSSSAPKGIRVVAVSKTNPYLTRHHCRRKASVLWPCRGSAAQRPKPLDRPVCGTHRPQLELIAHRQKARQRVDPHLRCRCHGANRRLRRQRRRGG